MEKETIIKMITSHIEYVGYDKIVFKNSLPFGGIDTRCRSFSFSIDHIYVDFYTKRITYGLYYMDYNDADSVIEPIIQVINKRLLLDSKKIVLVAYRNDPEKLIKVLKSLFEPKLYENLKTCNISYGGIIVDSNSIEIDGYCYYLTYNPLRKLRQSYNNHETETETLTEIISE